MGDSLAAADNRVMLATMLDAVEEISEVAGSFGSGNIWHEIRLSDMCSIVKQLAGIPGISASLSYLSVFGRTKAESRDWHSIVEIAVEELNVPRVRDGALAKAIWAGDPGEDILIQ